MRRFFSLLTLGALLAGGVYAADEKAVTLKVGDSAPVFQSTDDTGKAWKSSDVVGKKILVVYFYPADLTPGCTKQACSYRDDSAKLAELDIEVVGVSGDSVKNHEIFKKQHKLNFTLLADTDGSVAKKFGVTVKAGNAVAKVKDSEGKDLELTRTATASRWTYVIGKDGKIVYKNDKVTAVEDSKNILEAVKNLKK